MNDVYSRMKNELTSRRVDLMFKPTDMDKLSYEQRVEIEKLLMEECKKGNHTSFKYVSHFKTINPIKELYGNNIINTMSNKNKGLLYYNLLIFAMNSRILNDFFELAKIDYNTYSLLLDLYKKIPEGSKAKHDVYEMIDYIKDINEDKIYSDMFHKSLDNVIISKEESYTGPGLVLKENIGSVKIKQNIISNIIATRDKLIEEKNNLENKNKYSIRDSLYGFIVGDAFGVPVEFKEREDLEANPVIDMLEYGTHSVPKGTWSDDTSMTLATMDSLSSKNGIDYSDMMNKYLEWSRNAMYTATDTVFDIGVTTQKALYNYYSKKDNPVSCGLTDVRSNGNGSLMRIMPVCLYLSVNNYNEDDKVKIINDTSSLTHAHEISKMGCYIYNKFIESLLNGKDKYESYKGICSIDYSKYYSKDTIDIYKRILDGNLKSIDIKDISSSGYVVSTLEAVLWTILNTDTFKDSIIKSVNLGKDTDTVGAITGSLAGIIYGINGIPKEWLDVIPKKDYLDNLINSFDKTILNRKEDIITKN